MRARLRVMSYHERVRKKRPIWAEKTSITVYLTINIMSNLGPCPIWAEKTFAVTVLRPCHF